MATLTVTDVTPKFLAFSEAARAGRPAPHGRPTAPRPRCPAAWRSSAGTQDYPAGREYARPNAQLDGRTEPPEEGAP